MHNHPVPHPSNPRSTNAERISPPDHSLPAFGRLLGLDYGTRRLGIAVSDADQRIASPLDNHDRCTEELDAARLVELAREYRVVGLVVGLPVHMSGDEGQKAAESRDFGSWASRMTGLPVVYEDERYTSALAQQYLRQANLSRRKRKARLDKVAAQLILQAFLDRGPRDAGHRPGAIR